MLKGFVRDWFQSQPWYTGDDYALDHALEHIRVGLSLTGVFWNEISLTGVLYGHDDCIQALKASVDGYVKERRHVVLKSITDALRTLGSLGVPVNCIELSSEHKRLLMPDMMPSDAMPSDLRECKGTARLLGVPIQGTSGVSKVFSDSHYGRVVVI